MNKSTITREPITHDLKIYPELFSAVCTGVKRAELRKNDRDYRVGDTLHLMETPRGSCHQTGEFINVKITHITDVDEWMPGYVLLSIEREALDSESVILYRERNPYNGLTTGWQELTENELSFLKENAGENAEFLKLYRHAQPAVSKPWGYTSGILNPAVGMACVTPTRGKNQFPVYLDPQPVPVVPDERPSLNNGIVGFDEGWNACRAAMLQVNSGGDDGPTDDERVRYLAWDGVKVVSRYRHAQPVPVVPDGYVMVPKVPTEDMVIAGFESEPDEDFSEQGVWEAYEDMSGCEQAAYRARLCWAAMLAAAPQEVKP